MFDFFVCRFVYLLVCVSVKRFVCLCVFACFCELSACVCACESVCLLVCVFVCLFACLLG